MADLSKITSKFDLQKIIGDVKAMISPVQIPEANKNDPVGYCLSELSKFSKELDESHTKQADLIAKIKNLVGTLYQELNKGKTAPQTAAAPAQEKPAPQTAAAPAASTPAQEKPAPQTAAAPAASGASPAGSSTAEEKKPEEKK